MKLMVVLLLIFGAYSYGFGQEPEKDDSLTIQLLQSASEKGCTCVDSIDIFNKTREKVSEEVNKCIEKETVSYQLMAKLFGVSSSLKDIKLDDGDEKKEINININTNENSDEYKKYYYEIERYMMNHCAALKTKIASNDLTNRFSVSNDREALGYYNKGQEEIKLEHYEKAIEYYEKAVKIDPNFAFAWDNIGICYRKLNNYDKAIYAYKQSLEIDPVGMTPLQNIAIAYMFKQEYDKAIDAYQQIAAIDKSNPEVYYGIGNIYANAKQEYEKGLDYMCKAYILYIEIKSPYRADAEKVITMIYSEMKKAGKIDAFNAILKKYNITPMDK